MLKCYGKIFPHLESDTHETKVETSTLNTYEDHIIWV